MNFPESLKYTKEHEWISIQDGIGTIGITAFAQSELGDIVFVEVETVGQEIAQDEIFGTIEAVKTVSDLFLPISGEILELNPLVESSPELVNEDPYGEGWLVKIKIKDESEYNNLLSADDYKTLIGK